MASTQSNPPPAGGGPGGSTSSRSQRNSRRKRAVGVESPQVTPAGSSDIPVPGINGTAQGNMKDPANSSRKSLMLPLRGGGPEKANDSIRRYTREQLISYRSLRASNAKPRLPSVIDINSPENRDARRNYPPSGQPPRDDRGGGRGVGRGRFGEDRGGRGGNDERRGPSDWRQEPRFGARPGTNERGRGPNQSVDRQSWRGGGAVRKDNDRFDRSEDRYDARRNGRNAQTFSPRFGTTNAPEGGQAPRFSAAPVEGSKGFGRRPVTRPAEDKKGDGGAQQNGDDSPGSRSRDSPNSDGDRPSEVSYMRALPRNQQAKNEVVVPAADDMYRDEAYVDPEAGKAGGGRPDGDDDEAVPDWDADDDGDAEPFQLGVNPLQRDADRSFMDKHGYLPDTPVVQGPLDGSKPATQGSGAQAMGRQDANRFGTPNDQQDRPPEASPRDVAMVDRLLDDADNSASTVDRMFAAMGGGANPKPAATGAAVHDAGTAAGASGPQQVPANANAAAPAVGDAAAASGAQVGAPGGAVGGSDGSALVSGAAPSLQQHDAAVQQQMEADERRRAERLARYARYGYPMEPPPEVPDRTREIHEAMARGDREEATRIYALHQDEKRALRHYKRRQYAARQAMAAAHAAATGEDHLAQAHALGDEAAGQGSTSEQRRMAAVAAYRQQRYEDQAEYERALREHHKRKLAREAARRGHPEYDERYIRGLPPGSDRRAEAEAAAAYYAARGRSGRPPRTREEAIAERARLEMLARSGHHRQASYPRTYQEFEEEFDGDIPPLRNVPPEFSNPPSANQAYHEARARAERYADPRRHHFEEHLRQAYQDERRHHQQQRRLREQAYYEAAAAAAAGGEYAGRLPPEYASRSRDARHREAAYAAHQAARAAERGAHPGGGPSSHISPSAGSASSDVHAAPFRAETPEVTDFFASNPSPDEVIQFIETANTPGPNTPSQQQQTAPAAGPGSSSESVHSGGLAPPGQTNGLATSETASTTGDAPNQGLQPPQQGPAAPSSGAPSEAASTVESGQQPPSGAPSAAGGGATAASGDDHAAPEASAAPSAVPSQQQQPQAHDPAAAPTSPDERQRVQMMMQQQAAEGGDVDAYDQALPELPSLRGLSLGASSSSRRAAAAARAAQQQHAAAAAALGDVMASDPRDVRHGGGGHPREHYSSRERAELAARYAAAQQQQQRGYSSRHSSRAAALAAYQQQQQEAMAAAGLHHRSRSRGREAEEYARLLEQQRSPYAAQYAGSQRHPRTREEAQEYYEYERMRRREARHAAAQQAAAAAAGGHHSSRHLRTPSQQQQHHMMQAQAYAQHRSLEQYARDHGLDPRDPRVRAHYEARLAAREHARAADYAARHGSMPPTPHNERGPPGGMWGQHPGGYPEPSPAHVGSGAGAPVPLDDPRYPASDAAASASSAAAASAPAAAASGDGPVAAASAQATPTQQAQAGPPQLGDEQKPAFPPQETANAVAAN